MPIYLKRGEDAGRKPPPRAVRFDRAWELFLPEHIGDVPKPGGG
jgi:hypothetical protein